MSVEKAAPKKKKKAAPEQQKINMEEFEFPFQEVKIYGIYWQ